MTERSFNVAVNEEITPSVQEVFNHSGAIHKTLGVFTNNTESDAEYPLDITFAANRQALDFLMVLPNKKNSANFNLYVQFYKNSGATSYPLLAPGDVEVFMSDATAGEVKTSTISPEIAMAAAPMTDTIRIHGNVPVAAGGEVTLIAAFLPVTEMISTGSGYTLNAILETINQIAENVAIQQPYRLLEVDSNGVLTGNTQTKKKIDISGATDLKDGVLAWYAANNTEISGTVDFSSLTKISGAYALYHAFENCLNITSVDFSSLTQSTGYYCGWKAFAGSGIKSASFPNYVSANVARAFTEFFRATPIETVDFHALTTMHRGGYVFESCFRGCINLRSVDFSALTNVSTGSFEYTFYGCTSLKSVSFDSLYDLTPVTGANTAFSKAFGGSGVEDVYFPSIKTTSFYVADSNVLGDIVSECSDVKLHFPSNLTSTIAGLTGYPNFGGTNTQVLFDLPATE